MRYSTETLLFEAYRRDAMGKEDHKPLGERWLGLGTEAAYRPAISAGLMVFINGRIPPPRCLGWLCLTEAGIVAIEEQKSTFATRLAAIRAAHYAQSPLAHYQAIGGLTT